MFVSAVKAWVRTFLVWQPKHESFFSWEYLINVAKHWPGRPFTAFLYQTGIHLFLSGCSDVMEEEAFLTKHIRLRFCNKRKLQDMCSVSVGQSKEKKMIFISLTCSLLKVLLEKLLRSCPGVKCVYVMVRSKAGQSPQARIADMINCKVRSGLKDLDGKIWWVWGPVAPAMSVSVMPQLSWQVAPHTQAATNTELRYHLTPQVDVRHSNLLDFWIQYFHPVHISCCRLYYEYIFLCLAMAGGIMFSCYPAIRP